MSKETRKLLEFNITFLLGNGLTVILTSIYAITQGRSFSVPEDPHILTVIYILLVLASVMFVSCIAIKSWIEKKTASGSNIHHPLRYARTDTTDDLEIKIKALIETHQGDTGAIAEDMTDLIIAARADCCLESIGLQADFLKASARKYRLADASS